MKTWLVTGSSRGFGREIAKAALKRGDIRLAPGFLPLREHLKCLLVEHQVCSGKILLQMR